ncbi:MAG: hypothetical protein ACI9O6_002227 [Glaciecola sp.]|jgi:hypothetical protein
MLNNEDLDRAQIIEVKMEVLKDEASSQFNKLGPDKGPHQEKEMEQKKSVPI